MRLVTLPLDEESRLCPWKTRLDGQKSLSGRFGGGGTLFAVGIRTTTPRSSSPSLEGNIRILFLITSLNVQRYLS